MGYLSQPLDLRFFGKKIVVARAEEPDDIIWENQDVPRRSRRRRMFATNFFVFLVVMCVAYGILHGSLYAKKAQRAARGVACEVPKKQMTIPAVPATQSLVVAEPESGGGGGAVSNAADEVPLSPETASAYLEYHFQFQSAEGINPEGQKFENHFDDCTCAALGLVALSRNKSLQTACKDFYEELLMLHIVILGIAGGIAASNTFLKMAAELCSIFERNLTKAATVIENSERLLAVTFVNTFVVVNVLNAHYFGTLFQGAYNDFSPTWYATVGASVATTCLIGIVTPHVGLMAKPFFQLLAKKTIIGHRKIAKSESVLVFAHDPMPYTLPKRAGGLLLV